MTSAAADRRPIVGASRDERHCVSAESLAAFGEAVPRVLSTHPLASAAVLVLSCWVVVPALAQDLPTLSVADATANETDDTNDDTDATLQFVVSLSAATSSRVTFDYATSDGTAVEDDDYESASGTLTFDSGTVELTIDVSLVDDTLDELAETLDLTLSTPSGATISDGVGVGTIEDDDPEPWLRTSRGFFFLALLDEDGEIFLDVSLSRASGREVTVDYATEPREVWAGAGHEAESGSDYAHVAGTLTFQAGETSKTISIETFDDDVYEGWEYFSLKFTDPAGVVLVSGFFTISDPPVSRAQFAIRDDELLPDVTISDDADVESAGELAFPVALTGPIEMPFSMTYSTADGTAVAGDDYTSATDATLSFESGVTSRTIRVAVAVDDVEEAASETFSVLLSQTYEPLEDGVGDLEATGTILDDDGPVRLSINDATATEGDGSLSFTVLRSGTSSSDVTVNYATSDETAAASEDYEETSGKLTFSPDDTYRTITVPLVDDDRYELGETISVSLSAPIGAELEVHTATGTIRDDDERPSMTIHGSAGAETGLLEFVVSLGTASGAMATVDYVTDEFGGAEPPAYRLALAGSDFVHQEGSLTFAPGETSKTIRVQVLEDTVDEPVEAVVITLENPVNALFDPREGSDTCPWSGCGISACCDCGTIEDDDLAELRIGNASAAEADPHLEFTVELGAATDIVVTVSHDTSNATAVAGQDYAAGSGLLTFEIGTTVQKIRVTPLEDDIPEPTETFTVTLSAPVGATLAQAVGTGTITDDDEPALSVAGGSGPEGGTVDFHVTLDRASSLTVTVAYATADGTAVAVEDYGAASGTLTFAPGQMGRTVSVPLTDDARDEPAETFAMTLSAAAKATIDTARAEATITDNDEPPQVSIGNAAGTEGEAVAFPVTLGEASGRQVTVAFATSDGTAAAGEDYGTATGILTFPPGARSRTVSVSLTDDARDEPEETFAVELSPPPPPTPVNAMIASGSASGTATGTIIDNDEPSKISVAGGSGVEGGTVEFSVTRAGAVGERATVDYATSDGTAVAGQDYEATSGTLTFAVGESGRTVAVTLIDDDRDETAETFALTLSSPTHAAIDTATADGTIIDDDGSPQLSIGGAAGDEGDVLDFVVTVAGERETTVTVVYATSDGTAVSGVDYVATEGTLTFAPDDRTMTVSVTLLADGVDEPDETFVLRLSSPNNASLAVDDATGMIEDIDDAPTLSVAGGEGVEGGTVEFQVTLAGATSRRVSVTYATSEGTARGGEDYEAVAGTLTFEPGQLARTLSVSLVQDQRDEPAETFTLELSSAANATIDTAVASGTIVDDDPAGKAPTKGRVLLFESAAHPHRQGFVRVVNHSDEAGEVLVEAIDDAGMRVGPVPLAVGAGAAVHFNSDDLEAGNADKGMPDGVGPPGEGAWRLELSSVLDVEVLVYARTVDGFVTSLHDTAPATAGVHRAVFLNPADNVDQVSRLRLINPGTVEARVTVTGTDDGGTTSAEVVLAVPAGAAGEWTAAELESGTGTEGALGDGDGKWRLRLSSDRPVVVLSLIESPTGHLTNLSTLPRTPGRTPASHAVPLFPAASDDQGRQGFVRVVNRSAEPTEARIEAFDNSTWEYDPLTLAVGADEVAAFNSEDLEQGDADKGLTGSTGAGQGDWWLELSSGADIGVGAYIRTTDGFLTSMHDLVPEWDGGYRVVFFNPADNVDQVSALLLVNPGAADADVTISGVDDSGDTPGTTVRLSVSAGSSLRLTSTELESGEADAIDTGALGDGHGKWRLRVVSSQPLMVMSLLENPTGHLTNLSTATDRSSATEPAGFH